MRSQNDRSKRDRQARQFYALVWPHHADVLRMARFLCRDAETADDLAQETLLKAFRSIDGRADGTSVKPWLWAILRNTWTDRLRAARRGPPVIQSAADEVEAAGSADAQEIDFGDDPQAVLQSFSDQQVITALQALPAEIRWTLLLVDVQGLLVQEAAQTLGVPAGTIKSRAHRGRAMLRKTLLPMARDLRLVVDGGDPAAPTDTAAAKLVEEP